MKFINPIYLIESENSTSDDNGDIIIIPKERKVLAHISSIKQSEFYQAQANGLRPEIIFILRSFEYNGEITIRQGNKKYKLLRAFNRIDGNTELVCKGIVNNASA